ncbi:MAG: DNA polymerase III subunit beta [Syntrophomonadaceae bacterium]|nr:DNA polymerase III subunit beta [Syntrophomonadaceae bacterium]
MKLTIEKSELSSLTNLVYRAAAIRDTIPVLRGLLIEVSPEKGLTMTATDMEIGIRASTAQCNVTEAGSALVNAYYFADFIKSLPETTITLQLDQETSRLNVLYGRSSGFINTYQQMEYPNLPIDELKKYLSLPQKILREALKKTVFAAAVTHFRQVFTGVLFDIKADKLNIVASDTHRLAFYTYTIEQSDIEPQSFIIPTRTVNELNRVLEEPDELIDIAFTANSVVFYKDDFLLFSRLIEGQYPNYEQVIPSNFNTHLLFDSEALIKALERSRTMPLDDKLKIHSVQLNLRETEIQFNTHSEDMGEIEDVVEQVQVDGDFDFRIAFNTNYFLDAVKMYASENKFISIELSGSLGPSVIKNPQRDDCLCVLVPLRTSQ